MERVSGARERASGRANSQVLYASIPYAFYPKGGGHNGAALQRLRGLENKGKIGQA